jgi:hypothetical protein
MDPKDGGRNEGRREDGMVYVLQFAHPKGVREKGKRHGLCT